MYQIVTGVTSDIGMPSTYLVVYDDVKEFCFLYLLYHYLVYNNIICTTRKTFGHKHHEIRFNNVQRWFIGWQ